MEEVHVNDVIADPNKTSCVKTILSFDWDKDGKMRMYRVMGKGRRKMFVKTRGFTQDQSNRARRFGSAPASSILASLKTRESKTILMMLSWLSRWI